MGWDKNGRYYTRSRRENGRVVREYVGGGAPGALAARLDADARARREGERDGVRAESEAVAKLDAALAELSELVDLVARAALAAAGYAQHHRGEWRKRRGERTRAVAQSRSRTAADPGADSGVGEAGAGRG